MNSYPTVEIVELGMREGMQIESSAIPTARKIELLDALSETGLRHIVVGSFVSPRWTPQMADVDTLLRGFRPNPDVAYTALALNEKGRERWRQYVPPLTSPDAARARTTVHLCDVFVRRNSNRSRQDEIGSWPRVIEKAKERGVTTASIGVNAAWGSNFLGEFEESERLELLQRQYDLWTEAGVEVMAIRIGDPMGWNVPDRVERHIENVLERFPSISTFALHLHNARGTAPISAYAALKLLDSRHTLILDTTIGGIGGCPYSGNGRAMGMIPTEDLVDLLEEMGIPTGIDLDKLIEAVVLATEIIGRPLDGHVSKAGPRPRGDRLYPPSLPFIETHEQAQHFRLGEAVYEGALSPWREPITSPALDRLKAQ